MNGQINRAAGLYGVVCQGNRMASSMSPLPTLSLNFTSGLPGSFFTLRGSNFPPNTTDAIHVMERSISPVQIDATGNFSLSLQTSSSDIGQFNFESVVHVSADVELALNAMASLHPKEHDGIACNLQGHCTLTPPNPNPTFFTYLPSVRH